jgi:hypothetical protein
MTRSLRPIALTFLDVLIQLRALSDEMQSGSREEQVTFLAAIVRRSSGWPKPPDPARHNLQMLILDGWQSGRV